MDKPVNSSNGPAADSLPHDAAARAKRPMFSQTVEYALRATVYLASITPTAASADRISAATQVPQGYLSKVMRDLVVAGVAQSQRGPRGGFTLARPAEQLTILDVVNAVDPIQRILRCPLGNPCHTKLCPLHERLDRAAADIERSLAATTLAELITSFAVSPPFPTEAARQPRGI